MNTIKHCTEGDEVERSSKFEGHEDLFNYIVKHNNIDDTPGDHNNYYMSFLNKEDVNLQEDCNNDTHIYDGRKTLPHDNFTTSNSNNNNINQQSVIESANLNKKDLFSPNGVLSANY